MGLFEWILAFLVTYKEFFNLNAGWFLIAWSITRCEHKNFIFAPIVIGILVNFIPSYEKIRELHAMDNYYSKSTDEDIINGISGNQTSLSSKKLKINKKTLVTTL